MMHADYPYARGPPIGWRASLRREIDMKVKDTSYERFLLNPDSVSDVTDKMRKIDCNADLNACNDVKLSDTLCLSTPAAKKPVIDLTIEDEMSKMTLNCHNEPISVKNDNLNSLIPLPIAFIKTEPIEVDNDDLLLEMKNDNIVNEYNASKQNYKGRFFESTINENDILNGNVKKIVLTTSTLRGVFDKRNDTKGLNVISAPGATIKALSKVAECELVACKAQQKVNIVVTAGLNDFDKGHDLLTIQNDMAELKKSLKNIVPNALVNFVRLPLPPTLCKLPDNFFHVHRDRTLDILIFNKFLISLNDVCHDLSLESCGIIDPKLSGFEYWFSRENVFYTGRKHDRDAWRRTEPMHSAMHLDDSIRKEFWTESLENFFDFSC